MKARFAVVALALAVAGCKQPPMSEYTSPDGKFKGKFAGEPKVSTQTAAGISFTMYMTESFAGGYMIGVADMPIPAGESPAKIEQRLDGARDGAVANVSGKLKDSRPISLNGRYPGREFTATADGKHLKARGYLVGTRLYQLIVVGRSEAFVTAPEAQDFFDAFQVLDGDPYNNLPTLPAKPPAATATADPVIPPRGKTDAVVINSKAGKFKARFPADPKKVAPTVGGVELTAYRVTARGATYAVGYADLGAAPEAVDERLEEARDAAVKHAKGTLTESRRVVLSATHPGLEFAAAAAGKIVRGRVFLAGTRLYQVWVEGTVEPVSAPEATAFMDSFVVNN